MRSFWLSLLFFILLLCSCKTKDVAREVSNYEQITSGFTSESVVIKQDTTQTKKAEQTEEYKVINETIITKEYDKDTGNLTKETEEKRTIRQDTKTKTDESEERGLTEVNNDSTNHVIDSNKKVETQEEVKEESAMSTFFVSLGKWLGIGICVILFSWMILQGVKNKILHL